jgi:hypothetical protein
MQIRHTEMLLASAYKPPLRAWRDADITELLNLRTKSILAGRLNAKHPVWNSKVSNPSRLKFIDLFVNSNFEISAPQYPTHFVSDGRGDVLGHCGPSRCSALRGQSAGHHGFRSATYHVCILDHVKALVSCTEADKAAHDFAASIATTYRLSTETTEFQIVMAAHLV